MASLLVVVTDLVLYALQQAIYEGSGQHMTGSSITGDRGTQYLSMRYSDRLAEAGIAFSVGSTGDSYDCEHDVWLLGPV